MQKSKILALTAALAFPLFPASAEEAFVAPVMKFMKTEVTPWLSDPMVINAIKAQNKAHAGLDQAGIDELDKKWRAEVDGGGSDMINGMLATELSKYLKVKREASGGLITEIFIMDNKGLNVGQSDVTSDYWQGDEGKFQKSFGAGAGALFVDEAEKDESTQQLQSQASMTITDESGAPIGAVTVGINLNML